MLNIGEVRHRWEGTKWRLLEATNHATMSSSSIVQLSISTEQMKRKQRGGQAAGSADGGSSHTHTRRDGSDTLGGKLGHKEEEESMFE